MPPNADLPGFLHGVAPILDRWGYYAVAGFIGVESFGVPAPGQTIMVAAAIYAGAGRLNIVGVAAVAFIAAVLGDNVGYWIGARGGRKAVHRWGKYVFLTPERLERAEGFFARRGGRIVVVARFIDGLRQFNGVIAGITAMPWRTFLIFNTIGAALWVGWWTTVAYLLGTHLVEIIEHAHKYKWWAIGLTVVAVATYITLHVRHIKRRRARAAAAPAAEPPAAGVDPAEVEAILFDMDGTLVDSDGAVERAWMTWAGEYAVDGPAAIRLAHGSPSDSTVRKLLPHLDENAHRVAAGRQLELQYDDLADVVASPGAHELLAVLARRELPWAVVTSADSRLAKARLAAARIDVPVLVTVDDIAAGKPDPAGYLLAAELLGVDPAHCLVVEDAEVGLQAARAAGARTAALRGLDGDLRLGSLDDLAEFLS